MVSRDARAIRPVAAEEHGRYAPILAAGVGVGLVAGVGVGLVAGALVVSLGLRRRSGGSLRIESTRRAAARRRMQI